MCLRLDLVPADPRHAASPTAPSASVGFAVVMGWRCAALHIYGTLQISENSTVTRVDHITEALSITEIGFTFLPVARHSEPFRWHASVKLKVSTCGSDGGGFCSKPDFALIFWQIRRHHCLGESGRSPNLSAVTRKPRDFNIGFRLNNLDVGVLRNFNEHIDGEARRQSFENRAYSRERGLVATAWKVCHCRVDPEA